MLWLKALHITFMVTWFAGLFYLPRLFIYHATAEDTVSRERFMTMERRLFVMMTIGALFTLAFGLAMIVSAPEYLAQDWLRLKLVLVLLLLGYHAWCVPLMRQLALGKPRTQRWYRWFNE